jgi:hypothetical protein
MEKNLFFLPGSSSILLLLSCLLTLAAPAIGAVDPVEQFTGTHTRAVWIQEQGAGADSFAFGSNFKLMGYDSRDGKGERALLDEVGNFYKPILSPDGKKVVVSSRLKHEIYLVDFKKGKKKLLGKGVAVAVWKDPATGKTWVYALAGDGPENKYFTTHPLIRFPLKKPKKREPVWSKTHLSWSNFDLSRNGKVAGGLFPWPHAGILLFEQNTWKQYGKGCWTALSPDNSAILWVFDGLHRNLNFVDPFKARFWTVNINNAPGIGGYEVYHPRWTNHVRYLTMTGPYVEGEGGIKIGGGGRRVEVYLGRFSPGLDKVESWLQLTHNDKADFYPDVWLANGYESNFAQKQTGPIPVADDKELSWPAESEQLVFLWQDVLAENKLGDDSLLGFSQFRVTPRQQARFNRFLEMDMHKAGFTADWPSAKVLPVLKQKGGAGLELLFTPDATSDKNQGPVLRIQGKQGGHYLSLLQKGSGLELELSSVGTVADRLELPEVLQADQPLHLFITLEEKKLAVYVNGRLGKKMTLAADPLPSWKDAVLIFGSPDGKGPAIDGALSHVALFAGTPSEQQVRRSSQLVTGELEARRDIPTITFSGELIEISKVPAPEDLGAYQRALVVNRYQVDRLEQGKYPDKEILVAQWAVLDRTILPETAALAPGRQAQLSVEKFDLHPELEGERLMMDMFDPDLDIYYQVQ